MRMLCVAIFILTGSAGAADRPYMPGQLEKIEVTDLSTTVTIPPLAKNSSSLILPVPLGVAYKFTLNANGIAYLAACVSKAKKSFAADWTVNDPVRFRIDKARLYLQRPNGRPLRLGLIERTRILNQDGTGSQESAIPGATSHQNIPECR